MRIWRQFKGAITEVKDFNEIERFCNYYKEIEVDTETTGLDPHLNEIMCVQLGTPVVQYLIEWDVKLIPFLKELFLRTGKTFIFQNAKFDLKFFYKHGIYFADNIYDTFIVEGLLTCGLNFIKKSLDALGERYLGVDISKDLQSQVAFMGLTPSVIQYALNDVKYLTQIKDAQMKKVAYNHMEGAVKLDNSFVRALAYVEFCGLGFDSEKWLAKAAQDKVGYQDALKRLNDAVIAMGDSRYIDYGDLFSGEKMRCTINWGSPKQVVPLLEELGCDLWVEKDGVMKQSIGAPVLALQLHKHPLLPIYAEYAKFAKKVSTFGEEYLKFVHPMTGRIHTTYRQIVDTGRMSCGNKAENKPNLQQLEKGPDTRQCFVAKEGNMLISCDFSAQEQIVLANKCMDEGLLEFYDSGYTDMHSFVAQKCYPALLGHLTFEQIKDNHSDKRDNAKKAGFAINYGGNGFTISRNIGISIEAGDEVYRAYMDAFPGLKAYFTKVSNEAIDKGYIVFDDRTGMRRILLGYSEFKKLKAEVEAVDRYEYKRQKDEDTEYFREYLQPLFKKYFRMRGGYYRKALNSPIQGVSAMITKQACCYLFDELLARDLMGTVLLTHIVHDEIIPEAPAEMAEEIGELTVQCMKKAGADWYTRVPLTAKPDIAPYWKH